MLCMNWVCAGTFDDHEWVSGSTITQHEEEVMGRDLDCEICIPCVAVEYAVIFRTHAVKSYTGRGKIKFAKFHEVVNMAIAEAIS